MRNARETSYPLVLCSLMVRDFQPDLLSLRPPRLDGRGSGVAGWRWTDVDVKHTVVLVLRPDGRGGGYAAACAQTPIIRQLAVKI